MYFDLRKYILAALLTALLWILALTRLGYLPLFGVDVTLICIPVVIGTCALGLQYGMFLGFMFGLTSLYMALMGQAGALLAPILDAPAVMYPMIFVPRLLIPIFTWLVFKATSRWKVPLSFGLAALTGSVVNTVFFLGFAYFLGGSILSAAYGMGSSDLFAALSDIAISNGLLEAAVSVVICIPVLMFFKNAFREEDDDLEESLSD